MYKGGKGVAISCGEQEGCLFSLLTAFCACLVPCLIPCFLPAAATKVRGLDRNALPLDYIESDKLLRELQGDWVADLSPFVKVTISDDLMTFKRANENDNPCFKRIRMYSLSDGPEIWSGNIFIDNIGSIMKLGESRPETGMVVLDLDLTDIELEGGACRLQREWLIKGLPKPSAPPLISQDSFLAPDSDEDEDSDEEDDNENSVPVAIAHPAIMALELQKGQRSV
jgi:hypothetical protein